MSVKMPVEIQRSGVGRRGNSEKFVKFGQKKNLYLLEFLLQIGLIMVKVIVGKLNNLLDYLNY